MRLFQRVMEFEPGGIPLGLMLSGIALAGGCVGVAVLVGLEFSEALHWLGWGFVVVFTPWLIFLWALGRFGPGNRADLTLVVPESASDSLDIAELQLGRMRNVWSVHREQDDRRVVAETVAGLSSNGEFIEVSCRALPGDGNSELTIVSTPRVPAVWSDLGKGKRNVRRLERKITGHLASTARLRRAVEGD
jgi:hypothetical protein